MTKEFLTREYTLNKKSAKAIGKLAGVSPWLVRKALHNYGIPIRQGKPNCKDLTGKRFGRLVVLRQAPSRTRNATSTVSLVYWVCRCDCGNIKEVEAYPLSRQLSTTCGKCTYRANYTGVGELSGSYLSALKGSAKTRGIPFNVTATYLWGLFLKQNRSCALTGVELTMTKAGEVSNALRPSAQTASLDRIDSKKGYTEDNVQWVHKTVNYMKGEHSDQELLHWATLIANGPLSKK